ncbi:MAG: polysaccharide biosynthesis protein [Firmicutes bacterium]|nr:polysaccharide biosynthesis protein [Bacillota bacterium]
MEQNNSNKFLKGAAVLAVAGILVKVMGVFFRVPLTNWVGAEGMSFYSSVYPFYTFFLLLSTAGIPVAISRMISERSAVKNYGGAHRVFSVSIWLLGGVGFVSFLIMHFGAGFIETVVLNNPGTKYAIQAIAPSLFLVPVMAAYRGYFQGRQNMNPTAVSQLLEQFFRVCVGLLLGHALIKAGYEKFAAGAIFGSTAGAGAGLAIAVAIYLLNRRVIMSQIRRNKHNEVVEPWQKIVKEILVIAIPITIGACIFPLINAIDSMMVMRRLQAVGYTLVESRVLFGKLGGYCASLVGMPQVLIQAIVMSLVPAIAAAYRLQNKEDIKENTNFAMRATMIVGFPCTIGMMVLAYPILLLLYPYQAEEVKETAVVFAIMAFSTLPMSPMVTLTGALQGIDRQMLPVRNLAIGAVAKVIITYILVGIKVVNVNGASIGTIVCYIVAAVLNARDVRREAGVEFDIQATYIKPLISSAVMGVSAIVVYKLLMFILKSNAVSCLLAIAFAVVVYAVMVLITGTITIEEIGRLPKGDKLVSLIKKFVR